MSTRLQRRRGATAIEYGILAALIIVALIGILATTGTRLSAVFGGIGKTITSVVTPYSPTPNLSAYGIPFPSGSLTLASQAAKYWTVSGTIPGVSGYNDSSGDYSQIDPYAPYITFYNQGFTAKIGKVTATQFADACARTNPQTNSFGAAQSAIGGNMFYKAYNVGTVHTDSAAGVYVCTANPAYGVGLQGLANSTYLYYTNTAP